MCIYCKAASTILDSLWGDSAFRSFFYDQGYELTDLGPLTHDVFVPAYLQVKQSLPEDELDMLEVQVTDDLLTPLHDQPNFRTMWQAWDRVTREAFLTEQSEVQLARLLLMVYAVQFGKAYRQTFQTAAG